MPHYAVQSAVSLSDCWHAVDSVLSHHVSLPPQHHVRLGFHSIGRQIQAWVYEAGVLCCVEFEIASLLMT